MKITIKHIFTNCTKILSFQSSKLALIAKNCFLIVLKLQMEEYKRKISEKFIEY
ncbi:MAG: hypothetical protein HeimC3_21020 [Candidatus Heimdallarchaeota archaeon LC_3]|nr:MAG: hypothetical protein HeimC3_21020 [Candidatus Heimdallarchaeota archaeon LC_3]